MKALITPSVVATVACLFVWLAAWPAPAPAAERGQDRFVSNVRQLTFEGRRSGECYFSGDSTKLVFMSEREPGNPFFQIYMLDFETGDVTRISTGRGKTTCPYFQYTTGLIEFASTHLDPDFEQQCQAEYKRREEGRRRHGSWDYDEHYDIFVARPDGDILKRLTYTDGYDAEGAYSPDGKKIVFCSMRDAYPLHQLSPEQRAQFDRDASYFGEIYIMDADGSNQKRLTDWPGYDGGPFFTFDSQRIVWRHFEENGLLADVYTMKIDGTDVRRLTDFKSMSWAPYFHPSGEYCIFNTNKHGFNNFELYIVDAMGEREPVRVTYTEGFDALAIFSPDGKKACWTSNVTDTGMSQLFMADWDHQAARAALAQSPLRVRVEGAAAAGDTERQ
jgi:hypothetical protein